MKKQRKPRNTTGAMTKHDLMLAINRKFDVSQPDAHGIVELFFEQISEHLLNGGHCEFRDFGIFSVNTRKQRVGRDPHKPNEVFVIPERRVVKFKVGKKLRQGLEKIPTDESLPEEKSSDEA